MSKEANKKILLDHYKNPRNKVKDELSDATVIQRGANPQCGDEVEVGLYVENDHLLDVLFRGRGCSVCIASASMMTEAIKGKSVEEAEKICTTTKEWISSPKTVEKTEAITTPELEVVLDYPARQKCAKLSWEALGHALKSL